MTWPPCVYATQPAPQKRPFWGGCCAGAGGALAQRLAERGQGSAAHKTPPLHGGAVLPAAGHACAASAPCAPGAIALHSACAAPSPTLSIRHAGAQVRAPGYHLAAATMPHSHAATPHLVLCCCSFVCCCRHGAALMSAPQQQAQRAPRENAFAGSFCAGFCHRLCLGPARMRSADAAWALGLGNGAGATVACLSRGASPARVKLLLCCLP